MLEKLGMEQQFTIQQTADTVEREHFVRLWEIRKECYARLAAWLMDLKDKIEIFQSGGPWVPGARLESLVLGQIVVYGGHRVYSRAEFLRGSYEQLLRNLDTFADKLPPDFQREELAGIFEEAHNLLMTVREEALTLPDWGEPIPLQSEATARLAASRSVSPE